MTTAYQVARLKGYLAFTICLSVGLWAVASLSCAVVSSSTRPSQSLTTELYPATRGTLSKFLPSLTAVVAPQSADHHATLGNLLHTLNSAAAATKRNDHSLHQNVTFGAALKTELHAYGGSVKSSHQLCHWLRNDLPITSISPQRTVFLAGLLTNNEALMPHYILQLLEFASVMPAASLFVSVYESGSTDKTGDPILHDTEDYQ